MHPEKPPEGAGSPSSPASGSGSRRAFVTGIAGFTGGKLALELARRGYHVTGLVRPGSRPEDLVEAGVELREGDLRDARQLLDAAEGAELIFHIAAVFRSPGRSDRYYREVNVEGVRHVLQAAREHRVARVIHCSTVGVHGHLRSLPGNEQSPFAPADVYQVTKLEGEELARAAFADGLPGVIVRPAGIYGPGDLRMLKLFKGIQGGWFPMFGTGETHYHLTFIDDLVDGFILCSEHPGAVGKTYIIAGAEYQTLNELVRLIAAALGVPEPRWRFPLWTLESVSTVAEALLRPIGIDPPLHRRRAHFFSHERAFSIEKARRELGYLPEVGIEEGIRRTAEWYRSKGYLRP